MSLVQTLMQPLWAKYTPQLDKNEVRKSRYGVWDFFQQQSNLADGILDEATKANIAKSFGNTVQVSVLDTKDVTISNVRSCTIADDENTSKKLALTFITYSFGFTMIKNQYYNNNIGYQTDFNRKLDLRLLKFAALLDSAGYATLNNARNVYFPSDISAYYPVVGNALQVSDDEKNDYYNNLESIMNTMDYYGKVNIVTSTSGQPLVNRLLNQGANNGINEEFQLGGYEWWKSNRIVNNAGIKSTNFALTDGNVGVYNRNDPDAINGESIGDFKKWDIVKVPIVNLDMASYYYADCADKSALHAGTTGLTRTKVEGFEWSTDICYVTAYNSAPNTSYSPILKTEIAAPVAAV